MLQLSVEEDEASLDNRWLDHQSASGREQLPVPRPLSRGLGAGVRWSEGGAGSFGSVAQTRSLPDLPPLPLGPGLAYHGERMWVGDVEYVLTTLPTSGYAAGMQCTCPLTEEAWHTNSEGSEDSEDSEVSEDREDSEDSEDSEDIQ